MRKLPEASVRKSVSGPRSVAKAMVLAVGRPDRVEVGVLVLRELPQPAPVAIDDVEIAEPALVPGEDELLAVGAPGRGGDAAQLELDALHFLVAVHVHDEDVVPGTSLRREGEILPVGRPVRLRVDEPVGLVVAADAGLEDPPLDLAGDAVGEVQVDRVEILLAEVRDLRPVGREGGGEVQRPVRPLLGQQLVGDGPGPGPRADLRQVALLDRVAPLLGELLQREPDGAPEGGLDAARQRGLEDRADRLVAPALGRRRTRGRGRSGRGRTRTDPPSSGRWSAACPRATRPGATSPSRR